MDDLYDLLVGFAPGRRASMCEPMLLLIPVKRGNGTSTLLIRVCSSIVGEQCEIRVPSRVDAYRVDGLRLLRAQDR